MKPYFYEFEAFDSYLSCMIEETDIFGKLRILNGQYLLYFCLLVQRHILAQAFKGDLFVCVLVMTGETV